MAAISADLLALLADPETHSPLVLATDAELSALKTAIGAGKARRRDGTAPAPFEAALLREDKRIAYPIQGGIPSLLVEERIELSEALG
jgi:uncharacterized protein YbaR (Trm112 family)